MANDVAGNPLLLDEAGTLIVTGVIHITKIAFEPAAVGDQCQLKDGTGRIIFDKTVHEIGTANNVVLPEIPDSDFVPPLKVKGLTVAVLTSGAAAKVYHDGPNPLKTT